MLHTIATPAFIATHCALVMAPRSIIACMLWHEDVLQVYISSQTFCAAEMQAVQDGDSGLVEHCAVHWELALFQQVSQLVQHTVGCSVGFWPHAV